MGTTTPILQQVQAEFGYIPLEAMEATARHLGIPETAVYGVATFYAQFYLTRQGKHRIKVCRGTACHVRGGRGIMRTVRKKLGIGPGQTTEDYLFSLERVACLGSCALAPAMVVDDRVYGTVTPADAERLIDRLLKESDTVEKTESAPSGREA
ncbi:MAG: NADH-quinone oxidoreductase subunit NuoE [Planctomycetota bacterium]